MILELIMLYEYAEKLSIPFVHNTNLSFIYIKIYKENIYPLNTQISSIEVCRGLLRDMEADKPMVSTGKMANPLEYMEIQSHLEINNLGKRD